MAFCLPLPTFFQENPFSSSHNLCRCPFPSEWLLWISKVPSSYFPFYDCLCNVYLCTYAFEFVWAHIHMYAHECGGPRLISRIILNLFFTFFIDARTLNQTQSWSIQVVLLASLLWGFPVPIFLGLNYRQAIAPTRQFRVTMAPNSSPHAYGVIILTAMLKC